MRANLIPSSLSAFFSMRSIRSLGIGVFAACLALASAGASAQTAGSGHSTDPQSTGAGSAGAAGRSGANSGASSGTTSGAATQAGTAAGAQAGPGASGAALARSDQNMLKAMAQAQVNEIAAARVALDVSKNEAVRKYAQTMIDDHTKALDNITALARSRNVSLPTEPDTAHKAMATTMRKMNGDAFDKAYMKQAGVGDHTKVHNMLQRDASGAKDPDVKALASTLMPTVDSHLDAAKSMQGGSGTAGTTASGSGK